jgi:protein SCO1
VRLLASLALALLVSWSLEAGAAVAPDDVSEFAFQPHPGAQLPLASEFTDDRGAAVTLGNFFVGKPAVVVLDYLRCKTLCGLTLENLVSGLATLPLDAGRDYQVVVISIDPRDSAADTAAAKAKYVAAYAHPGGDRGWHFLAGPQPAIQRVADAVGFRYRYEPELDQYIHPAGFVVAAPDGSISRYLLGVAITPQDLQAALADAANGPPASLVTRLLLLCRGDSPGLGRYSLAIEGSFVIANLMTVIGAVVVFVAIRRRRHG